MDGPMQDTQPAQAQASSYWNATAAAAKFPRLQGQVSVDVAVIGGGIVGVTTARALKDLGITVAVVEARRVGRQVTGKSTAKVTSQHRLHSQRQVRQGSRASLCRSTGGRREEDQKPRRAIRHRLRARTESGLCLYLR